MIDQKAVWAPPVTTLISVSNKVNHIAGGKTFSTNVQKSRETWNAKTRKVKFASHEKNQMEPKNTALTDN